MTTSGAVEQGERVRLADVAHEAGVSLATISKVLNGKPDVAPDTRERVEALLAERGYRRRSGASSAQPELIELVFHELDRIWSMELIDGVESIAKEHGLSVVLTVTGDRHSPGIEWLDGVLRRRPAGVILVFSELAPALRERLRSRAIPFVIVDPAGDPSPDVPSVGSANWSGGLAATRHLIELGHRRIAAITGPEDMMCSLARLDGFRSAMNSVGLPIEPGFERFGDFHVEGGRRHAHELLSRPDRPTAIFAGSDLQALGALEAARALGLRVPEDVSIVGYDDIPLCRWVSPRLTTVHQPLRQMGVEAARLVLAMGAGGVEGSEPVARMDLATSLVVRDSSGPPPALERARPVSGSGAA